MSNRYIDGDAIVGRNATVSGDARVNGSISVGQSLTVEGWLDAPNLRTASRGLYASAEALNSSYPSPTEGWFAGVQNGDAFDLYIARGGAWHKSNGSLSATIDNTSLRNALNQEISRAQAAEQAALTAAKAYTDGHPAVEAKVYVTSEVTSENPCVVDTNWTPEGVDEDYAGGAFAVMADPGVNYITQSLPIFYKESKSAAWSLPPWNNGQFLRDAHNCLWLIMGHDGNGVNAGGRPCVWARSITHGLHSLLEDVVKPSLATLHTRVIKANEGDKAVYFDGTKICFKECGFGVQIIHPEDALALYAADCKSATYWLKPEGDLSITTRSNECLYIDLEALEKNGVRNGDNNLGSYLKSVSFGNLVGGAHQLVVAERRDDFPYFIGEFADVFGINHIDAKRLDRELKAYADALPDVRMQALVVAGKAAWITVNGAQSQSVGCVPESNAAYPEGEAFAVMAEPTSYYKMVGDKPISQPIFYRSADGQWMMPPLENGQLVRDAHNCLWVVTGHDGDVEKGTGTYINGASYVDGSPYTPKPCVWATSITHHLHRRLGKAEAMVTRLGVTVGRHGNTRGLTINGNKVTVDANGFTLRVCSADSTEMGYYHFIPESGEPMTWELSTERRLCIDLALLLDEYPPEVAGQTIGLGSGDYPSIVSLNGLAGNPTTLTIAERYRDGAYFVGEFADAFGLTDGEIESRVAGLAEANARVEVIDSVSVDGTNVLIDQMGLRVYVDVPGNDALTGVYTVHETNERGYGEADEDYVYDLSHHSCLVLDVAALLEGRVHYGGVTKGYELGDAVKVKDNDESLEGCIVLAWCRYDGVHLAGDIADQTRKTDEAVKAAYTAADDATLTAAKTYADSKDAATLTTAKAYTDEAPDVRMQALVVDGVDEEIVVDGVTSTSHLAVPDSDEAYPDEGEAFAVMAEPTSYYKLKDGHPIQHPIFYRNAEGQWTLPPLRAGQLVRDAHNCLWVVTGRDGSTYSKPCVWANSITHHLHAKLDEEAWTLHDIMAASQPTRTSGMYVQLAKGTQVHHKTTGAVLASAAMQRDSWVMLDCTIFEIAEADQPNVLAVACIYGPESGLGGNLCRGGVSLRRVHALDGQRVKMASLGSTLQYCSSLKEIDASGWDVSAVTNTANTFGGCSSLRRIDGLAGLLPASVTDSQFMFSDCAKMTNEAFSALAGWDISNVTNTRYMLQYCHGLKGEVRLFESWRGTSLQNAQNMFIGCANITRLEVPYLIQAACTNAGGIIQMTSSLEHLGASGWVLSGMAATFNVGQNGTTVRYIEMGPGWMTCPYPVNLSGCGRLGVGADGSHNGWGDHLIAQAQAAVAAGTIPAGQSPQFALSSATKAAIGSDRIAQLQALGVTIS